MTAYPEHSGKPRGEAEKVALIGNPNVGKSVIFGLLTGKYVTVSNYPGTTVEVMRGNVSLDGRRFLLIDTPGVNSLMPMSEDERVTRDILLDELPASVVQVGDAKNLRRTLLITIQLAEMGIPFVLDLNMVDEAMDRGISLDMAMLRKILGIEVIGTIAPQRKGLKELREAMLTPKRADLSLRYHPVIEEYIGKISALIPKTSIHARALAVMILSDDESLVYWLKSHLSEEGISRVETLRAECSVRLKESAAYMINTARIEKADEIASRVIVRTAVRSGRLLQAIGAWSMHPVYGIPVLLAALFLIYQFVGVFGAGILVDFMQNTIFGQYLNPMITAVVKTLIPVALVQELLVGEYGIFTVAVTYAIAIILPITVTFFIAFAILEDSGYLPRLAIMSNRVFNIIGLNGKAILPMILGLGCGTMAVMTSRILETRRDRIITTFLLALAIPCSAQLGVILGMLGSLSVAATLVWTSAILTVLFLSGFLASKLVRGDRTEFFLEIPPIRVPSLTNIMMKTVGRVEWYLREAVPLFIVGTLVLFLLHKFDLINLLGRVAAPVVVTLLGLPEETTWTFILGFLRRDYGAAGLFKMAQEGLLSPVQSVVSLVTMTLFVPCLASFLMIIKERGMAATLAIIAVVFPTAFLFGGLLNWLLRSLQITL